MASILRKLVAGPREHHPEADLDLCYVTDSIVVTSGPSSTYPQRAYRNPTDRLVKFLDHKHGADWAVWEFRAEGTGYPDSEVHGRVHHYPWPDHHPPPFELVPNILASMRNWLKEPLDAKRVVVVHCKAGKGRSGTVVCSYLISEEGWTAEDAMRRFTERRMRSGFGNGISIPSQLRWVRYVDYWAQHGKKYVERPVEVVEVHVWGLREGVKVCVQGFVEEGKKIKTFHTFKSDERVIVDPNVPVDRPVASLIGLGGGNKAPTSVEAVSTTDILDPPVKAPSASLIDGSSIPTQRTQSSHTGSEAGGNAVIFRPKTPIGIPSSNICLDLERRSRAPYGWTLVTSVAHVWFNVYFETRMNAGGESSANESTDRGVFDIDWDAMDGIKGSSQKGIRAADKVAIVWRAIGDEDRDEVRVIEEPRPGEAVPEAAPADWAGGDENDPDNNPNKDVGIRRETMDSANVSKASSVKLDQEPDGKAAVQEYEESVKGVKSHVVEGVESTAGTSLKHTETPDVS